MDDQKREDAWMTRKEMADETAKAEEAYKEAYDEAYKDAYDITWEALLAETSRKE